MSNTDFDPDAYLSGPAAAPAPPPAAPVATPAPKQDSGFDPNAYLAQPAGGFDPDAYLKSASSSPTPHQAYRASVKALAAAPPEQPAGVGAPEPADFTTERVPAAELAKEWGNVAYGVPKGAAAFPAGGFLGDVESLGRHVVGANPNMYFPSTVEGGYLGPKGLGLMNPAATPEEAIGMGVGAMLVPGPKMLRGLKEEAVAPELPATLTPGRNPLGVTLTEGEALNDATKRAAEQRLIRQQDPHALQFMEQRRSQLAQAPLEAASQLDPVGQVPSGSSIQAADSIADALDQHQGLINQQLQANKNLLAAAHEDMRAKLSPTGTVLAHDPMDAATVIQGAIGNEEQRAQTAINGAYEDLRNLPGQFHPAAFNQIGDKIIAKLNQGSNPIRISPEITPQANAAVRDLDDILGGIKQNRDPDTGQILPREPITPQVVEETRKRLNSFYGDALATARASHNWSDVRATRAVMDTFDGQVADRLKKGTFTGGDANAVVATMKQARGLYADYRNTFTPRGAGDSVGQAIQKILGRYEGSAATPEQLQGMLYSPTNPQSVQIAGRLKDMFGETSPEFGAAKQGLLSTITERVPGKAQWEPEEVADRIDQFTKGPGRSLLQAYLAPDEIARLQTYGKAARQHASDLKAGEDPFAGVDWQTTFRQAVGGSQKAVGQIDKALTRLGPTSPAGSTIRQGLLFNALQPVQGVEKWGFKQKADNLASLLQAARNSSVYGPEHRQVIQSYIDLLRKLETPKGIWEPSGPAVDRLKMGIERGIGQLVGYTIARHIPGAGLAMDLLGMRLGGEGASFLARRNVNKIRTQLPIVADEMQKWQAAQARFANKSNWATKKGVDLTTTALQESLAPLGIDLNKLPQQRAAGGGVQDSDDQDNSANYVTRHTAPFPEKPEGYEYIEATHPDVRDTPAVAPSAPQSPVETLNGSGLGHPSGVVGKGLESASEGESAPPEAQPPPIESVPGVGAVPASSDTDYGNKSVNRLLGAGGEERYQTWPERMIRSGTTLAGDVMSGQTPIVDPVTGHTSDEVIQRAQDMAALAGGAGMPSAEEGVVGMAGGKLSTLPMDEASRLARAKDQNYTIDAYHGTRAPNEITEFQTGNIYSDNGELLHTFSGDPNALLGPHFASTPSVANKFAAGTGADWLKTRYTEGNPAVYPVRLDATKVKAFSSEDELNHLIYRQQANTPEVESVIQSHFPNDENMGYRKYDSDAKYREEVNREAVLNESRYDEPQSETAQSLADEARQFFEKEGVTTLQYPNAVEGGVSYVALTPPRSKFAAFDRASKGSGKILASDTSQPATALAALEHTQPFYSAVEQAITNAPQQKMHGSQWFNWLKNQPGIKQEELDWLGLKDNPDLQGLQTKQQLLDHVQALTRGMPLFSDTSKPGAALSGLENRSNFTPKYARSPIASHTDADGYTSVVTAGNLSKSDLAQGRRGVNYIVSPTGQVRKAGYWMDYPENSWGFGSPIIGNQKYMGTTLQNRLELEAQQQATAYAPLKEQFLKRTSVKNFPFDIKQNNPTLRASGGSVKTQPHQQHIPRPISHQQNNSQPQHLPGFAAGGRVDPSQIDRNPSAAQIKSGTYSKDHVHLHGLAITLEHAKGHTRSGIDKDGRKWTSTLPCAYGYIRRVPKGADKDHLDVYLGPHTKAPHVFIIDQLDKDTKKYDEAKIGLGFGSKNQFVQTYKRAFSDGKASARIGAVHSMTLGGFKRWLKVGDTTAPFGEFAAEKLAHRTVAYVESSGSKSRRCYCCTMYYSGRDGGPGCTLVKDPITPGGVCLRFEKK